MLVALLTVVSLVPAHAGLPNSEVQLDADAEEEKPDPRKRRSKSASRRGLSHSNSEDDEQRAVDPFSPEKARGRFSYTVHSPRSAETTKITRSARHSLGSPPVNKTRLSFQSPSQSTSATSSQKKAQK